MKIRSLISILIACAATHLAGTTVMAGQILPGHVPEAIGRFHLQPLSHLAGTNRLNLVLQLPLRDKDALTHFLAQLYDPGSKNFHKFLTPDQFTERFGPTAGDYQAVMNFARQHGFEIVGTHNSRLIVDARGRVSDIEAALHIRLQRYQHPMEPRVFYAPDAEPTVDAGVPILNIGGLSDYAQPRTSARARARGTPGTAANLATGSGLSGLFMSKDLRNAYLPGSSLAGSGQQVGLFETDGYYASDITLYEKFAGLTNVPLKNVLVDGATGTPASGELEVPLDIEMTIAMAPALAGVVVYECPGSYSQGLDVINDMATNTQINQFSSSIGYTGASPYNYFDQVFQKMMAQGQSYFQAAGDGDAWTTTIWAPAASPYITAVGGTSLTTTNNGTGYISEKVWNIGSYTTNKIVSGAWSPNGNGYWGSGGGVSAYYSIPYWQTNLSMTANLGSTADRNLPDVAMPAIYLYVVYNNGTTNSYAVGTSAAAPLWAGFAALINQQAAASGKYPVGFLNAAIYPLARQTNYTNVFHDITTGNNFSSNSPANYPAVTNYDLCTGLGTPHGTNLIYALVAALPTEAPQITAPPAVVVVAAGGKASFSVTASGAAPLFYYWLRGGAFMTGQTNATFTTNDVQLAGSGTQFSCLVSNAIGSATSAVATLTVELPPSVVATSPTNLTVAAGGAASFTVAASGGAPLYYSWMDNGAIIDGATNATYSTNNVQLTDSGTQFSCLVSNAVGTATSQAATLTVDAPPAITGQPTNESVAFGNDANFTLTATGTAPLAYFWLSNSLFMPGKTNATFTATNVHLANSGQNFSCVVTNLVGSVTSEVATLTVVLTTTQAPAFSISITGTNLTVSGSNGVAGGSYSLYASTNLLQPASQWTALTTNVLGANGNFTLTATNAFHWHAPAEFYLLQVR